MRCLVLLAIVLAASTAAAGDKNDELVKEGFNFTTGVTAQGAPVKVDFLATPSDDPIETAFRAALAGGR